MEKDSKPLKRRSVLVKRRKKINRVVGQCSLPQKSLRMMETGVLVFQVEGSQSVGAR